MIGIPNPSSTDKEFGRPCLDSGIHGVESRIQNCHEEKSDLLKTNEDIAPQLQRLGILQTFETWEASLCSFLLSIPGSCGLRPEANIHRHCSGVKRAP